MACYRYKKKKLSLRQKIGITISILLLFIIFIILYINFVVNPIVLESSEASVNALAMKAIGRAIYEVVNSNDVYSEFINITKDKEENITMLTVNAMQANLFAKRISRQTQTNLDEIGEQGIQIALGTFSGLPILAGRGPKININVSPVGAVATKFHSEFEEAGVNQTIHRIYVNIITNLNIVLPTTTQKISTNSEVLICESVIVGKVPDAYLQSDSLDEMMNLIPAK